MSNFDYYAVAADLISHLDQDGHADEGAKLRTALEEGATGTEILMALRFHLAQIIKRVPLKGETKMEALRLFAELDAALK